ncbi:MAG: polysaccharide biosynthesis/export family protein [bacterium]
MKNKHLTWLLIYAAQFLLSANLLSQEHNGQTILGNQISRYSVDTEDNLLLPVNILGLVNKPGQYMVPYRTDLITLIAFAGGFRDDAKVSKIKIVRNVAANSKHAKNSRKYYRARVFVVDVKRYFEKGDQSQIPILMPDDTIIVSGSTTRTVNKIFDFVGKGIMLAQLYFLIRVASD